MNPFNKVELDAEQENLCVGSNANDTKLTHMHTHTHRHMHVHTPKHKHTHMYYSSSFGYPTIPSYRSVRKGILVYKLIILSYRISNQT